jgi:hypothetical protein
MIACIFEHIQWRWALNDFTAEGYCCGAGARRRPSAESPGHRGAELLSKVRVEAFAETAITLVAAASPNHNPSSPGSLRHGDGHLHFSRGEEAARDIVSLPGPKTAEKGG